MNFHTGGAQHPPYYPQPGQPPHYSQNRGPPPLKKPKGNPVITRYPPPPGYRPPVPPPSQHPPTPWQQPAQAPAYSYPTYGGYQQPPHGHMQPFQPPHAPPPPPPQYAGYPPHHYAAHGLPLNPTGFPFGAQPGWQAPITSPQSAPPVTNLPQFNPFDQGPRRHSSAPYPSHQNETGSFDENADPFPPQYAPGSPDDDVEDDFLDECYFARHPERIDPRFSLGLMEWKAPLPTRRPLPSTFEDAELEALAPRAPKASDDESISEYFVESQKDESLNSVRLSDTWHKIKDDLIFREFPAVCREILSLYELLTMYKDRFDPEWAAAERTSPTPDLSRDPTPAPDQMRSDSMDMDSMEVSSYATRAKTDAQDRILDDLEHALGSHTEMNPSVDQRPVHSRSTSVTSQSLPKLKRPKPLAPVRDQAQEDVLAALGVTGSPKLVYETPGPAFGPPPDSKSGQNSRSNSVHSARMEPQGQMHPLPSPHFFKHDPSPSHDPWSNGLQGSGYAYERPTSADSQHTAAGSDFASNDNEATPRPSMKRQDSRKRGHTDSEDESIQDREHHDNDVTPKQRRKQKRVGPMLR